ncbi:MAG: hypothetical protein K6T26_05025 [Alicyclobacillus sp.]|nr:hypothetical protein [Alicyclobacillus sp.]
MALHHVAYRYLGQWVHCHSVYGWHRGVLTQVRPGGIILGNAVQLAAAPAAAMQAEHTLQRTDGMAVEPVQFFGGFFIPFGGLYGIYPGFGFGFGGFFW